MSDEHTRKTDDRAVWALIELYALAAIFHGFDVMRPDGLWAATGWWIAGGALALIGWHWARVKTWISPRISNTAAFVAADFRWWMVSAIVILLVVTFSRFVEERRWPYSGWSYSSVATEARESTLIEWLAEAQKERDQAIAERKAAQNGWAADRLTMEAMQSQSAEMRRQLVDAEAQKATLIEWLQNAKTDANKRSGTPNFLTFAPEPAAAATAAEECANLAHRLSYLRPNQTIDIEHLRSAMTALGCGCGASKK